MHGSYGNHRRVLPVGWDVVPPPPEIASWWEDAPDNHGTHPQPGREGTAATPDYDLARSCIRVGNHVEASAILERLHAQHPAEHRLSLHLAICHLALHRTADLRQIVRTLLSRLTEDAAHALDELELCERTVTPTALPSLHVEEVIRRRTILLHRARPDLFPLRYLEVCADFSDKNYAAALAGLQELAGIHGPRFSLRTLRGEILLKLRRWEDARAAFTDALALDPQAAAPLLGLARAALAERKFEEAARHARASTDVLHLQPRAHYLQGLALHRTGRWQEAEQALRVVTTQTPLSAPAWRLLAEIARIHRKDDLEARRLRLRLEDSREMADILRGHLTPSAPGEGRDDPPMPVLRPRPGHLEGIPQEKIITIVSGLPDSGSSHMMRLLHAAGLPLFTDGSPEDPESRLDRGEVATLMTKAEHSWLAQAAGHAVKIPAHLLPFLPPQPPGEGTRYRILFMERDIGEILRGNTSDTAGLSKACLHQERLAKNWLNIHGISSLPVAHSDLVRDPSAILPRILAFVRLPLPEGSAGSQA